ncbi:3-hydroxybutyrate dehydrogenase [Edaphocola aurantiacus]|uniref:3-hydroxybutyrate dehydrogenase n=1 Tax=Edaphocola aurantiacus TaxID=2601682 RepID=UPI001C97C6AD|nr:3-hydroxybutyrate dehydrogenase [Edaphocola aurantiacus]
MSSATKRTVLITGSTSGIGMAIARMYAQKGYNIIFNGLEPNGAEIAAGIAAEFGIDHLFFPANMADPTQISDMAAQSLERFGVVDILINNAGIQFVSPVEDFPDAKWDAIIDINLNAAFHMTKALWPAMKAQKFGRIINIASAHGLIASPFKSAYVSSKFGIVGFTKTMALEGGEFGITANAVCPGYVFTPIVENQIPDQMKAHNMTREEVIEKVFLKEHAVKEFITVEAIAESVLFLTESAAASVTTGIALSVDAGWTAH